MKYTVTPVTIQSIWEDESAFTDEINIELELPGKDNVVVKLDRFGWFKNYIYKNNDNISDIDIIGEDVWAVINENEDIECFSDTLSSSRIKQIINISFI